VSHSVADFVTRVLVELHGFDEARAASAIDEYVEIDPRLLRTGEIHDLRGDASRARRELGWQPEVDFKGLVRMMVQADIAAARA